jgi:hypothetical protein
MNTTTQKSTPNIDRVDPNNPIFRHVVGGREYSFSLRRLPTEEDRIWLMTVIASHLDHVYACATIDAKTQIRKSLHDALML